MKRNDWKILLGSIIFTYLFYQQQAGINWLIFSLVIVLMVALNKPTNFLKPSVLVSAAGTILSAIFIYLYGTSLPMISLAISLSLFTSFIFEPNTSLLLSSFHGFISVFLAVPRALATFIQNSNTANSSSVKFSKIALLFIPLVITIIFFFLYRTANPNFLEFTKAIHFNWVSLPLVRFFLFGMVFIYGLISYQTIKYLEKKDLERTDDILTQTAESHQKGFIGKNLSIENEIFIGAALLIMLNILLAIVNSVDMVKLWPNQVLPENQESYSQYLHSGIQMLITSIILAVGIIMFFFRGYFNYMKNALWLKVLAYIWISQNVLLLISAAIRNNMYIQDYGLSHKRIGVFIYLLLATIGLGCTFYKLAFKKNNLFLFRKNAWAFYLVLLLATPVRWDMLITNFNFALAKQQNNNPDISYLSELSHTNISTLIPYFNIEPSKMYLSNGLDVDSHLVLNKKLVLFLQDMTHQDWQSQCAAKQQNYQAILDANHNGEIPSIVLNQYNVSLEALKGLTNLKGLTIERYQNEEDFEHLKHFKKLEVLNLSNNYYNVLDTLPFLEHLKYLNLENNYLSDIEKLSRYTSLEYLRLSNNKINDYKPLFKLNKLKELYIDEMSEEDQNYLMANLPDTKIIFTENYNYSR